MLNKLSRFNSQFSPSNRFNINSRILSKFSSSIFPNKFREEFLSPGRFFYKIWLNLVIRISTFTIWSLVCIKMLIIWSSEMYTEVSLISKSPMIQQLFGWLNSRFSTPLNRDSIPSNQDNKYINFLLINKKIKKCIDNY